MIDEPAERSLDIREHPEIPWLSVLFGYGPMVPFVFGAAGAFLLQGDLRAETIRLTLIWAAAILAFLAGVRRGLSFRTQGGPAAAQIATMFCLFVVALVALFAIDYGRATVAAVLLALGFLAVAILDPIAARDGQAPLFFARLRPTQTPIAVVSLAAIVAALLLH